MRINNIKIVELVELDNYDQKLDEDKTSTYEIYLMEVDRPKQPYYYWEDRYDIGTQIFNTKEEAYAYLKRCETISEVLS